MTFDNGYDFCAKEIRKILKENKLEGIWNLLNDKLSYAVLEDNPFEKKKTEVEDEQKD